MKKILHRFLIAFCLSVLAASMLASAAEAKERYVVAGASGILGEQIVKELLERGVAPQDLILVSHRPERLDKYKAMGATVREGDVNRPETLATAYVGGTKMAFVALGLDNKESRSVLHKRIIDAAIKSGVKHIVYASWIGAQVDASPISHDHTLTENTLRASGVQWTILRLGEYADRWVVGAAEKMAETGRAMQPIDERWSAPVLYKDCAAASAAAMLKPEAVNKIYNVLGPARITQTDIARVTSEITGKKIEIVQGKPGQQRELPVAPPPGGNTWAAPPAANGEPKLPVFTDAEMADNSAKFKQLTGRNPAGLREMLEANKAELLKKSSS